MKEIIKKIIEPNKVLGFLLFNLGMGLLIYVFGFHLEESWIAYIAYLLSAYALVIFVVWFYKACKFSNDFIKNRSKLYKMYHSHFKTVTKVSIVVSLILNLIYGILKLTFGIYYQSEWFITFAVYYLLLWLMRFSLIFSIKKEEFGSNLAKEYRKLKHTGIILLLLDIVLTGMIILIIHQNQTVVYPGYLIYLVALYDFILIISAFINLWKYGKKKSPILIASKCINVTVAMISMLSLEVAMIYQFGSDDTNFKLVMTSCTGFGIALINSLMAILMIRKSIRKK